ncbi:MAG: hypothetical protein ISR44_01000 [Rhodospirillales bacterium]|nr:hypothetical protein [Rhodospirillales bacterium]
MATEATVNEIFELVGEIMGRNADDVLRNSKWGEYNFDDCREDLEVAYSVIRPLPELPMASLSQAHAQNIVNNLTMLRDAINNVMEFTVMQDTSEQIRNQLASALTEQAKAAWERIAPWIGYLFFQAGDVSEGLKKIAASQGHVDDALEKFLEHADYGQAQIKNAVAAAKEAAGTAGVGLFTKDFAKEATNRSTSADMWLGATAVFAIATGLVAFVFGSASKIPEAIPALLQYTTMRVVILSLLFTGTIWCARMYKTNKHQQSVNKHRADALQTFQAFVEATTDPAVRDAVLMETTRSIFTITPSGYLGESDSSPNTGSKVIEIVKAASKAATDDKG